MLPQHFHRDDGENVALQWFLNKNVALQRHPGKNVAWQRRLGQNGEELMLPPTTSRPPQNIKLRGPIIKKDPTNAANA